MVDCDNMTAVWFGPPFWITWLSAMDDRPEKSQGILSEKPWNSLALATLAAPPLGSIIVSIGLHFATRQEFDRSLTDSVLIGLYLSSLGYLIAVPVAVLYAAPLLWLTLRYRVLGVSDAAIFGILPGVILFGSIYRPGVTGSYFPAWTCLIGSVIATSVFIYDGYYRRKPKY